MTPEQGSILIAVIGLIASFIVAKTNTKPNLQEASVKNATALYEEYKGIIADLKTQVTTLEEEVKQIKDRYEQEIAQLKIENKELIEENTNLKILLGGKNK
ncbi:hypothetical protein IGK74_002404 [Enterococcus sp. AZ150]|uniref:hypothetical protein n=1 Tax=Enterococcus sp. AZ150 TaxID=2774866 RepID=UPI003F22CF29